MTNNRQPYLSWQKIKAKAAAAAQANLDDAIRKAKGIELPSRTVEWNSDRDTLDLLVGSRRGVFWKEQKYFLVDSELNPETIGNRFVANYRAYYTKTGILRLELPSETQERLKNASKLKAFRADDDQISFAQLWVDALKQVERGPLVTDLWSQNSSNLAPWSPEHLPKDRALNRGQQRALAAMTSEGGRFVWGPPGTGKTTVITSAVHEALAKNKTVLITSHTNVAVDNVLKGLVEDDLKYSLGIMKPGKVVRHSGNPNTVLDVVRNHEYILLDKAAAVLTEHEKNLEMLSQQQKQNSDHPDRTLEMSVFDQLNKMNIDVEEVRRAHRVEPVQGQLAVAESELRGLSPRLQNMVKTMGDLEAGVEAFAGMDDEIASAENFRDQNRQAQSWWAEEKDRQENEQAGIAHEIEAAHRRQQAAELRQESMTARIFPWVAKRHRAASFDAAASVSELQAANQRSKRAGREADEMLETISQDWRANAMSMETLLVTKVERDKLCELMQAARQDHQTMLEMDDRIRDDIKHMQDLVLDEGLSESRMSVLRESEGWELVAKYDGLLKSVETLDEDQHQLKLQRKQLEDKFRSTKTKLLAEAPVVATTMTALSSQQELQKRRFDVVIIDEAASAESPSIVYAASKADTTLAIVGDFLQNAPISDADDAVEESQREIVNWQKSDIFALAGITDRASAEEHERCVAISMQYRYPPIIADLVNKFCYDGLLESHKKEEDHSSPLITFLDTSGLAEGKLVKAGTSWKCDGTVDIAMRLAGKGADGTIGYVTPYKPQADAMRSAVLKHGTNVEAGTAHRFQGREFNTVIIDLMQDDRPRWVSAADLNGPERAVSAAKLLNVALTRAKKDLYLIGNWSFVKGYETPGMQALAELEGHRNFVLVENVAQLQ